MQRDFCLQHKRGLTVGEKPPSQPVNYYWHGLKNGLNNGKVLTKGALRSAFYPVIFPHNSRLNKSHHRLELWGVFLKKVQKNTCSYQQLPQISTDSLKIMWEADLFRKLLKAPELTLCPCGTSKTWWVRWIWNVSSRSS